MSNSPDIKFYMGGVEVSNLDLGIVPAGTVKQFIILVKNVGPVELQQAVFKVSNDEVKVISSPDELGSGKLVLEYAPSKDVKKGVKAMINVSGVYVV